jgi:hypothetical protein
MKRLNAVVQLSLVLLSSALMGSEVAVVTTDRGESFVVEFNDKTSEIVLEDFHLKRHGENLGRPRSYEKELTAAEKNDIHYIMTTLANSSLISIAIHRSSLESAGDRIDHIHPIKFLTHVFTNEELKVAMRNIRGRGWIWGDFSSGVKESLATEAALNNIKKEFIHDLAKKVELHSHVLIDPYQNNNWEELIETLITKVPRKGDYDRYDS